MSIPIKKEPEGMSSDFYDTTEKCFFCDEKTLYWYTVTNMPVCPSCAKLHDVEELM